MGHTSTDTNATPRQTGDERASPCVVVMAKQPVPGAVKTRLMPMLSAEQAAAVHAALLACVLERLPDHLPGPRVLALAGLAETGEAEARRRLAAWGVEPGERWQVVDQGAGDLGRRIERVWRGLGGGPAVCFGVDSPDVPAAALAAIGPALRSHDVALGPCDDGGYWTVAAPALPTPLLHGIDWGTASVYHQSTAAAAAGGLSLHALPPWHDVDEPADLDALADRLAGSDDPALRRLERRLHDIRTVRPAISLATAIPAMTHDPSPLASPSSERPAADAAAPAVAPGPDADFDVSDSTILIVDDNEQNVELLQAYLETLPCTIATAYDGLEALQYVEDADKPTPDLILLDVMMPRMSGFEVCRKIKEDPATRMIPIMMVTALNELGDIERGVESGTDDFVSKPVNKLELITRVKSLLRVRHLKRELDRTEAYIRDIEGHRGEQGQ